VTGERPADARHVYANPLNIEICPILALAVHFVVNSFDDKGLSLFPGSSQYERYQKALQRLLSDGDVQERLKRYGVNPNELGSHSTRKGSSTYVTTGVLGGPTLTAVSIRTGWLMPGVTNTYIRYDQTGDRHVGRVVSGLPVDTADFAYLPPHFPEVDDTVRNALEICFRRAPPNLTRVLEFALATLVHYSPELLAMLPPSHPLLASPFFAQQLWVPLKPKIVCRIGTATDVIRATGIASTTALLRDMKEIANQIREMIPHIDHLVPKIAEEFRAVLDERQLGSPAVTRFELRSVMDSTLKEALEKAGVFSIMEMLKVLTGERPAEPTTAPAPPVRSSQNGFLWKSGVIRRLPETFEFPSVTCESIWLYYMCGDSEQQYPPLRKLEYEDMPSKNLHKRFSDLKFLMSRIEDELKRLRAWKENPTVEEASRMFTRAEGAISIPADTDAHRVRRSTGLRWLTVVDLLRKAKKANTMANRS